MTTGLQQAIDKAGTQQRLADQIGVSPQTISAWIKRGSDIPPDKCVLIERAYEVSRQVLRPDDWNQIWPELSEKQITDGH